MFYLRNSTFLQVLVLFHTFLLISLNISVNMSKRLRDVQAICKTLGVFCLFVFEEGWEVFVFILFKKRLELFPEK